jgi:hypothetical protein
MRTWLHSVVEAIVCRVPGTAASCILKDNYWGAPRWQWRLSGHAASRRARPTEGDARRGESYSDVIIRVAKV